MERRDLPIGLLLRILRDLPELTPLREAILSASTRATQARGPGRAHETIARRVLPLDRVEDLVQQASRSVHQRVRYLYEGLDNLLHALAAGDRGAAVDQLLALADAAQAGEQWAHARPYLELAVEVAEPSSDRRPLARALRHHARLLWNLGEAGPACSLYSHSLAAAQAAGDRLAQIKAYTGLGNVRSFQGRWAEAQSHYQDALALCTDAPPLVRGQLCNNLSIVARERDLWVEAEHWLEQAARIWQELPSPVDLSVWHNSRGMLHLARGEAEQAETAFYRAFEYAPTHFDRAMVLDNLAELALRQGRFADAETAARRAEEHALAAGSPRALAEVYLRLGKIARLQGDASGATFFVQALELCGDRRYPLLEGTVHLEYGLFQRSVSDAEAARQSIERARALFADCGATRESELASQQLAPA